jgi:Fe-S-cluster containining protein
MTVSCDTCSKPGACCNDFFLNGRSGALRFSKEGWEWRAAEHMDMLQMPFIPLRIVPNDEGDERDTAAVRFTCPKVTPEGRCSIYETRPQLCRDYAPGQDRLCVMYVPQSDGEGLVKDQL